jgi:hypothetical protein
MNGLNYTTIIEFAEPLPRRRGFRSLGSMRIFIIIACLLSLCGCSSPQPSRAIHAGMWRQDDNRFSAREREIIAAARGYLEKQGHKPVEDYYKILHTKDGYTVYVTFAAGSIGETFVVLLREDASVIDVIPYE